MLRSRALVSWYRRGTRIAARDHEHLRLADLACGEALLQSSERRVVTALEADEAGHAGVSHGLLALARPRERQIDRFFAKDRFLRSSGATNQFRVRVGRRGDDGRLHGGVAEGLIGAADLRAVFLGELSRRRSVHVDDVLERDAGLANEVARVNLADASGSEECNIGHRRLRHRLSIHSCTGSFLKCHARVGPAITLR